MAYWLKCWPAIGRLQVRAPLGAVFLLPWAYSGAPLKWEGVCHCILWRGCNAIGLGELVNISNLCHSSFLISHICRKTVWNILPRSRWPSVCLKTFLFHVICFSLGCNLDDKFCFTLALLFCFCSWRILGFTQTIFLC